MFFSVLDKGAIDLPQLAELMREFKAANPGKEWANIKLSKGRCVSVDAWKPDTSTAARRRF